MVDEGEVAEEGMGLNGVRVRASSLFPPHPFFPPFLPLSSSGPVQPPK